MAASAARSSGFTHDREEHAIGVCAIGAAIRIDGAPAHAISVAVPASRFDASLPLLQAALAEARTGIERSVATLLS